MSGRYIVRFPCATEYWHLKFGSLPLPFNLTVTDATKIAARVSAEFVSNAAGNDIVATTITAADGYQANSIGMAANVVGDGQ